LHGSEITVSRNQNVGTNVPVSSPVVVDNKHADVAGHADRIQVVYEFDHHSEKWCGLY